MTAKEMFEKLGYKYCTSEFETNKDKYFYYEDIHEEKVVRFDLVYKEIWVSKNCEPTHVDIPTIKAIHKQLEELGWLND